MWNHFYLEDFLSGNPGLRTTEANALQVRHKWREDMNSQGDLLARVVALLAEVPWARLQRKYLHCPLFQRALIVDKSREMGP